MFATFIDCYFVTISDIHCYLVVIATPRFIQELLSNTDNMNRETSPLATAWRPMGSPLESGTK